jgi:hypothetical protein
MRELTATDWLTARKLTVFRRAQLNMLIYSMNLGKGRPQPILVRCRHDQVDMVGHQAISPDLGVRASRRCGDQAAVKAVI